MRSLIPAFAAAALATTSAAAADLTVDVRDAAGQPVKDAVVMLKPAAGVAPGAASKVSWPLVMAQQNISFQPYVLVVAVGSTVSFPNKDKVRHHVYSFSAAKKFELKLYGRDESRSVTFDKVGPVALGCNIHDSMIGFIYVTDTPYAAKSGADGVALLRDVPAGGATLAVWHPDLKSRTPLTRGVAVGAADQRASMTVDLRPAITKGAHPGMAMNQGR